MRPRLFLSIASIAAFTYACGGVDSALISGSGGGDDDDDSSTTHDAGSTHDGSVPGRDGGDPIADGGGGGGEDSGGGGKKDAGGPKDGGIGPTGPVVPATCGTQSDGTTVVTCNTTTPTCCADQSGVSVTGTAFSCTANASGCTGTDTLPIQCRDSRDCTGGKVCCGDLPSNAYTSLGCVAASACPETNDAGGFTEFVHFCTPSVADPCATFGETCQESTLLPGFYRCE